jgi:Protein of unknown function (DUF2844)
MKITVKVLLILIVASMPAWATLGQYEGSVSVDQQNLRSADLVQSFQAYKVHQLTTTNGTVVREFVSPKGTVFGIAWQSRFMPDMKQLLGDYLTNYQSATKAQTQIHQRRGLIVKTNDFVFVSNGHMRFYKGLAYVPSLVPNNVSAEVVK